MREKRCFAERTKALRNNEVRKKYFLVFEGKETEAIYFEAVDCLRSVIDIDPIIEFIPIIRSYSEEGWSNPEKIIDRINKNIDELHNKQVSFETILNWIMDYLQEMGVIRKNRPLAKCYWERMKSICEEQLNVTLDKVASNANDVCITILNRLVDEMMIENVINEIPNILETSPITYSKDVDKICLIVDRDKNSFTEKQYDYVVQQSQERGYGFYITNPCFEFWLLMHFNDVHNLDNAMLLDNSKVTSERRYCEDELRKRIPGYNKSKYNALDLVRNINVAILNEKNYCEDVQNLKHSIGSNIGILIQEMQKKQVD